MVTRHVPWLIESRLLREARLHLVYIVRSHRVVCNIQRGANEHDTSCKREVRQALEETMVMEIVLWSTSYQLIITLLFALVDG